LFEIKKHPQIYSVVLGVSRLLGDSAAQEVHEHRDVGWGGVMRLEGPRPCDEVARELAAVYQHREERRAKDPPLPLGFRREEGAHRGQEDHPDQVEPQASQVLLPPGVDLLQTPCSQLVQSLKGTPGLLNLREQILAHGKKEAVRRDGAELDRAIDPISNYQLLDSGEDLRVVASCGPNTMLQRNPNDQDVHDHGKDSEDDSSGDQHDTHPYQWLYQRNQLLNLS